MANPTFQPEPRFRSRRERAAEWRRRMAVFSRLYNTAYRVRDAYTGSEERQLEAVLPLTAALVEELRTTRDPLACVYALVDALTCSPHGLPWEA